MDEPTLKEKTSKGLFWGGMSNFLQQLLNAAFGIYLARTLSPDDYGLVGMLTVFNMLALTLQEGGFVSALINRKQIVHEDYNAVFWFNVLVSVACYIVLFFCAPLIARYFHQPELVRLSRWSFLGFVLAGLGTSHRAYLTKKLMIKELALVGIIATTISGIVGIYLAWKGYAYWTLVIQALVLGVLTNVGFWVCSKWRPSFRVNFQPVKEMLHYSIKLIITSILGILNGNLVTVILGRYYPVSKVGYYTQANKWSTMGTNVLSGMINSVAQPVLASVVDERERQLRVFRKMVRFASFVSFPAMFGLAFIAQEFITIAITDKWMESSYLMQILCVGGAFIPLAFIFSNLILSQGRSSAYMWSTVSMLAVLLMAAIAVFPLGISALVMAYSVVYVLWVFVWFLIARKSIGYSILQLLADIVPFVGVTCVSIGAAWFLTRRMENIYLLLTAKVLLTAGIYMGIMWLTQSVTFKDSVRFFLKRNQ